MKTYNFKMNDYAYDYPVSCSGEFIDRRNGIVCINPSVDLKCYLNYIELLNSQKDKWVSFGYLDLGMMPFIMLPSFMPQQFKPELVRLASRLELPCYDMPPVSVLLGRCKLPEEDIWVYKEDVAKIMGISKDKVTLERFLRSVVK